jgi:hypothetical protein
MKKSWLICLLMALPCICISQTPASFPVIDNQQIPDAKFGTSKTYNGSSLFGLIDGGAELFLEYGFEGVWVNQLELGGEIYRVEIYRMNGAEEAFGIYSVSRYQCKSNPPLSKYACQTQYQLQFCSGPFYISIINNGGTQKDSLACLKIGTALASTIQEQPVTLQNSFPGIDLSDLKDAILVKGSIGIMNSLPDMADFFGDIKGFTALIMKHPQKTAVSIRFSVMENLFNFVAAHQWDLSKSESQADGTQVSKVSDLQLFIIL